MGEEPHKMHHRFVTYAWCNTHIFTHIRTSPLLYLGTPKHAGRRKVVELEAAEDDLDSIQQEIKMLQAFNCPQLTRYHGSFIVGR